MSKEKRTATFVKNLSGFTGEARLYKTSDGEHVVASSTSISWGVAAVSEVMIFASDENGRVTDWRELGVAYPAGEFTAALADAGFEVAA